MQWIKNFPAFAIAWEAASAQGARGWRNDELLSRSVELKDVRDKPNNGGTGDGPDSIVPAAGQ